MTPKAERLIRNLARRLDQQWPGVAASILEGLDEILTVVRSKLPKELRQSLACTNIAENMMGTIRRVTRNVKRWRDAGMALLWVAAHANTPVTALVVIGRQSVVRDDRFCWRFVSLWSGSRFRQVKHVKTCPSEQRMLESGPGAYLSRPIESSQSLVAGRD